MNYAELCAIIERNRDARRALERKKRHPATRPEKHSVEAPASAPLIAVGAETSNPVPPASAPIETPEAPAVEAPAPKKKKYHKKKKAVEENTTDDPA